MEKNIEKFLSALSEAAQPLVYRSETDAPVTVFTVDSTSDEETTDTIGTLAGGAVPLSSQDAAQLIERLTSKMDYFVERQIKMAEQYAKLFDLLRTNLSDLKLYRAGSVNVQIFVVGRFDERTVAGIRTNAVET